MLVVDSIVQEVYRWRHGVRAGGRVVLSAPYGVRDLPLDHSHPCSSQEWLLSSIASRLGENIEDPEHPNYRDHAGEVVTDPLKKRFVFLHGSIVTTPIRLSTAVSGTVRSHLRHSPVLVEDVAPSVLGRGFPACGLENVTGLHLAESFRLAVHLGDEAMDTPPRSTLRRLNHTDELLSILGGVHVRLEILEGFRDVLPVEFCHLGEPGLELRALGRDHRLHGVSPFARFVPRCFEDNQP